METTKALDILSRAREQNTLICLYTSRYSDKFVAGFVEAFSDKHVILRSISVHGRYGGWLLRNIEDVPRIDWGGRYEESLLFLSKVRQTIHPSDFLTRSEAENSGEANVDLVQEILLAAQRHDYMVSLDPGNSDDIIGFVKAVESSTVSIALINEQGESNGVSVVELDMIEKINVDDDNLQDWKMLARWHDMEPPTW